MTWRDFLSKKERAQLDRAQARRDAERDRFNQIRSRLKNRAEARMRSEKRADAQD